MNRLERWAENLAAQVSGCCPGILDVCLEIHGAICGSGDGMAIADVVRMRKSLEGRLEDWTPGSSAFDNAVYSLVKVTIEDARHYEVCAKQPP